MKKIEIQYEDGRMVFTADGEAQFYMDKAQATLLFGSAIQKNFVEDFSEWNLSQDFIARFDVVREHFQDLGKVAKFLKVDVAKLKRFASQGGEQKLLTIKQGGLDDFPKLKEKIRTELFPDSKPGEQPKAFMPDMNKIKKVARLLLDGMKPDFIADELGVDYSEYIRWSVSYEGSRMINIERNKIVEKRRYDEEKKEEPAG